MALFGDLGKFVSHVGKEIIDAPKDVVNFVGHTAGEIKDLPKDISKGVSNVIEEGGKFVEKVAPQVSEAFGEGLASVSANRTQTAPIQTQALPKTQQPKQKPKIDLNQEFMYQILIAVGVSVAVALILRD